MRSRAAPRSRLRGCPPPREGRQRRSAAGRTASTRRRSGRRCGRSASGESRGSRRGQGPPAPPPTPAGRRTRHPADAGPARSPLSHPTGRLANLRGAGRCWLSAPRSSRPSAPRAHSRARERISSEPRRGASRSSEAVRAARASIAHPQQLNLELLACLPPGRGPLLSAPQRLPLFRRHGQRRTAHRRARSPLRRSQPPAGRTRATPQRARREHEARRGTGEQSGPRRLRRARSAADRSPYIASRSAPTSPASRAASPTCAPSPSAINARASAATAAGAKRSRTALASRRGTIAATSAAAAVGSRPRASASHSSSPTRKGLPPVTSRHSWTNRASRRTAGRRPAPRRTGASGAMAAAAPGVIGNERRRLGRQR
jgi:hypothetical protein